MSLDIDKPSVDVDNLQSIVRRYSPHFDPTIPPLITTSYSGNKHVYLVLNCVRRLDTYLTMKNYTHLAVLLGSDFKRENYSLQRRSSENDYFPYVTFETNEGAAELQQWVKWFKVNKLSYIGSTIPAVQLLTKTPFNDNSFDATELTDNTVDY